MSIKAIRDAFNEAAAGKAVCSVAKHGYVWKDEKQFQSLTFSGTKSDGMLFSITSGLIPPSGDLLAAARFVGENLTPP